jgi:hypothetical protein
MTSLLIVENSIHDHLLVVTLVVPLLEQDEIILEHNILAEDHGEELVVGDVLVNGCHDVSRLLHMANNELRD